MTGIPKCASKASKSAAGSGAEPVRTKRKEPGRKAGFSVSNNMATMVGTILAQVITKRSIHDQKCRRLKRRAMITVLPARRDEHRLTTGAFTWKNGSTVKPRSRVERR